MNLTEKDRIRVKKAFKGIDRKLLCKGLNSSENTVTQVVNGLLRVSPERAKDIERILNGAVKASVLRPDIFT